MTGRVANRATGIYLEGAQALLKNTNRRALTDQDGRFTLEAVTPGTYTLVVSYTGLESEEEQVTVNAGDVLNREFSLTSNIYRMSPITVTGEREGAAKTITLQRNADNVRNIVDAEAFGTIADGNIGDFLKLMPGVNSEGKNGETWSLRIRGLDPAMNSVTVDGFKTAGAQLDSDASRSFDVGVTPIEGISTLEVTKSPTPAQPADSMGGAINLISRSALDRKYNGPQFSASAGVIARTLRNHNVYNGRASFQDLYSLGGDTRNLAISVTASSNDNYIPNNRIQQSWSLDSKTNTITGLSEFRVYEARITRRRAGGTFNVDYRLSPNSLFKLRTSVDYFNQKSYENYIGWKASDISAQHWLYWKKRHSGNIGLIGEHKLSGLKLNYGLQAGSSTGNYFDKDDGEHQGGRLIWKLIATPKPAWSFDFPANTGMQYTSVRQTAGLNFLDPTNWVLNNNGFRIRNIQFNNDTMNAYVNGNQTFNLLQKFPVQVQSGLSYTESKVRKVHDEKSYNYSGTGGLAAFVIPEASPYPLYDGDVFINGGPYRSQWMSTELANANMKNNPSLWTYNQNSWYNTLLQNDNTITEGTSAAYTQGTFKFGRFSLLTGVRFERTEVTKRFHQKDNGIYQPNRTKRTADYDRYFPSAHLKYNITQNFLMRASYSQTIGRPNYSNLLDDENIDFGTHTITRANTGLKPMTSQNFDYTIEYYFEPVGMVSANYFEKKIKDFIQTYNFDLTPDNDIFGYGSEFYDPVTPWKVKSKTNAGNGTVRGIELAYQQQFTFLPGPLKGLGGYANYTHIETSSQKGGSAESGSLTNYVPNLVNVGLSWRYRGFQTRLRYNWKDRYLTTDSPTSMNRVYTEQSGRFDINTSYDITRRVGVYVDIFNVFDAHEIFLQGDGKTMFMTRDEDNGARYSCGVNIRL